MGLDRDWCWTKTRWTRLTKKCAQPRGRSWAREARHAHGAGRESGTAGDVFRLDGGHYRYRVTSPDQLDLSSSRRSSIEARGESHKNVTARAGFSPARARRFNRVAGLLVAVRDVLVITLGRPRAQIGRRLASQGFNSVTGQRCARILDSLWR